jgi:hypothetical protein
VASDAPLIVQAIAISQPRPNAKPLIAAITGLPKFSTRLRTSRPTLLDPLRLDRSDSHEFADICSGDERVVTRPRQDDAAHSGIISGSFEGCSQIRKG